MNYDYINRQYYDGATLELMYMQDIENSNEISQQIKDKKIIPLCMIDENGMLEMITAEKQSITRNSKVVRKLIVLMLSEKENEVSRKSVKQTLFKIQRSHIKNSIHF